MPRHWVHGPPFKRIRQRTASPPSSCMPGRGLEPHANHENSRMCSNPSQFHSKSSDSLRSAEPGTSSATRRFIIKNCSVRIALVAAASDLGHELPPDYTCKRSKTTADAYRRNIASRTLAPPPISEIRAGRGLIVLLGITRRSGTNYCHTVLTSHPECTGTAFELWEDFLVHESHRLLSYAAAAANHWNATWGAGSSAPTRLVESLGEGLTTFLRQGCTSRYLIAKTPSLQGIEHIPALFPACRLIVVVRDGRDVVASGMRSFGWSFDHAVDLWTTGARHIMRFCEAHPGFSFLLIHYEHLVVRLPEVIGELCSYLDLTTSLFDLEAALRLPILGSCDAVKTDGRVHWGAVERPADFQPVGRWRSILTENEHAQFWDRARDEMASLGYERDC